jgi:hypothetical protein
MLPAGATLDVYLDELEEKWNRIINPQAKKNLTEDVNSLIRDYLRKTARTLRAATFTSERIQIWRRPSRRARASRRYSPGTPCAYIQLYMVKLVLKS